MELRSVFTQGDVAYLAHLCHDCRACYQACPYTEPHELAIDIPALMAAERERTYRRHARPSWLYGAFTRGPVGIVLLTIALIAGFVLLEAAVSAPGVLISRSRDGFYGVVSHAAMAIPGLLLAALVLLVTARGARGFWLEIGPNRSRTRVRAWLGLVGEIASLRWMRGGGEECFFPDEQQPSPTRRHLHALVMYGFLATFAATASAFVAEEGFGQKPPYSVVSVPVLLGLIGGIGLVIGTAGLILQKRAHAEAQTSNVSRTDDLLLITLLAVSLTGLALLCLRNHSIMGTLLIIHLATVATLYVTMPYGRFLHVTYRAVALRKSVNERHSDADPYAM
jgi:citrate/tricarballylate utilization protein